MNIYSEHKTENVKLYELLWIIITLVKYEFFFYFVALLDYIYYNGFEIMEKQKKYEINFIFQINNNVIFQKYFIFYKLNKKYYINMYIGILQILRIYFLFFILIL